MHTRYTPNLKTDYGKPNCVVVMSKAGGLGQHSVMASRRLHLQGMMAIFPVSPSTSVVAAGGH